MPPGRHYNSLCPCCSRSGPVSRTLPSLCGSDLLYRTTNVCSGLHVWPGLREPPTLRDADWGCHRHRAQCWRQNEAAVDCAGKQTKREVVGVWSLWAGTEGEMWFLTPVGGLQSTWEGGRWGGGDGKRSPMLALLRPRLMCGPLRGCQWSPTLA